MEENTLSSFPLTGDTLPEELSVLKPGSNIQSSDDAEANSIYEDCEEDNSIHAFNNSNVTVIEKLKADSNPSDSLSNMTENSKNSDEDRISNTKVSDLDLSLMSKGCEGSDSGVEFFDNMSGDLNLKRTQSNNSGHYHEFGNITPARSCDSSIISCCSNYEEAYNILARRNSTLMEDFNLRSGDGTSENESESSSLSRSSLKKDRNKVGLFNIKKKNFTPDSRSQQNRGARNGVTSGQSNERLLNRSTSARLIGSSSFSRSKQLPPKLPLSSLKKDTSNKYVVRNIVTTKTPTTTPTDDGRWPSINSKPAPLMGRTQKQSLETPKSRLLNDSMYATFPRRRKEKDSKATTPRSNSKENSSSKTSVKRQSSVREGTPFRTLPPFPKRKSVSKTIIYHETGVQTALTNEDIDKALAGVNFKLSAPHDKELGEVSVQVDIEYHEVRKSQERLQEMNAKYEKLKKNFDEQQERLRETERRLEEEKTEKEGLKEELKHNSKRVLAILGHDASKSNEEKLSSDSLVVLESRFRNVSDIVIKQENEISELHAFSRTLKRELDKSLTAQQALVQHLQELESETKELQEFMQAEKNALSDALKESETEIKKLNITLINKNKELENKVEECRQLQKLNEHKRSENLDLQSRLSALESNYKEILVEGSKISSAAIALSLLKSRLDCLNQELIKSYNISESELEDVIFHNEAYTNSPDLTPDQDMSASVIASTKASSFVSAIINAIKNAASQSLLYYRELGTESMQGGDQSTSEILDLETEPCLMMEPVLEDVVLPDTHSQNLVSSSSLANSIRLTRSESLTNLTTSFNQKQFHQQLSLDNAESMAASLISNSSSFSDFEPSSSLLDQIIHLDNLVTKLLKILRIIQIENEEMQRELQEERDDLKEQVQKQKEGNKVVAKQLNDWESLGSRLKLEIKELKQEVKNKNSEIQVVKCENEKHKKEIEKLNEDVCTLSTLTSKCERFNSSLELTSLSNTETHESKLLEKVKILEEKIIEKEKQLQKVKDECRATKKVQTENFKMAIEEAKKQYKAIDNALEILHSIQPVVQEYPQLAKLQSDLEDLNFQTVTSIPVTVPAEFNSNTSLVRSVTDLEIPSPINSTA